MHRLELLHVQLRTEADTSKQATSLLLLMVVVVWSELLLLCLRHTVQHNFFFLFFLQVDTISSLRLLPLVLFDIKPDSCIVLTSLWLNQASYLQGFIPLSVWHLLTLQEPEKLWIVGLDTTPFAASDCQTQCQTDDRLEMMSGKRCY